MASGRVTRFDAAGGWGELEDTATGRSYPFHCTAIADGSRMIDTGVAVSFELTPGRMGRWEGRSLRSAETR